MPIYPWEYACMQAILETDDSLIHSRIVAARSIIAQRLDGMEPINEEERSEIDHALGRLKVLEQEVSKRTTY
jgi:hypothetical protein